MFLYVLLALIIVFFIQMQWKRRKILKLASQLKNKYIAWPIIGHGLMYLGSNEDHIKAFMKIARETYTNEHGLTGFWLGPMFFLMTCDAVVCDIITKTSMNKPLIGFARHLLGNGLIFAPVDVWRPRRKILAPTFSSKNLNCFIDIFEKQSNLMLSRLKQNVGGSSFSIWEYITSYTMDSVCLTVLGVNLKAQQSAQESKHPVLKAFEDYCKGISNRLVKVWLYWDPLYKLLPAYTEAEKNKKIIHDMIDETVRRKRQSLAENGNVVTENDSKGRVQTFLELLMTSPIGNAYTDEEIREETIVLLFAGTDTTAVSISFTMMMLSRHLDVQQKVYEEIREVFGDSKGPITPEDLSKLKYLEAVIRESIRLHPPVPIIVRKTNRDITLPSGITIPADTNASLIILGTNRNPRYWGADAEEFNPDRFMNGTLQHPTAFMTFSFGPRNCLGYQFAMLSMKVALTSILREYKVMPPSEILPEDLKKPLRVEFNIMMKAVDGFKLRLEERCKVGIAK